MADRAQWLEVIRGGRYLSLAMCDGGRPYMIALNYAFDAAENCFYAHSAASGRKLAFAMFVNNTHIDKPSDTSREGETLGRLCEIIYSTE